MADFPRPELDRRLTALSKDLAEFPPGAACPWPLARIFNELVKHAKRELPDDPIMRITRLLEEGRGDNGDATDALVGTVRALITQVRLALEVTEPSERT